MHWVLTVFTMVTWEGVARRHVLNKELGIFCRVTLWLVIPTGGVGTC
jgi:hypothetical protein